jgi:predicted MFS family arabinose efflux permease
MPPSYRRCKETAIRLRFAAFAASRGLHFGWFVVAATFLTLLVAAGAVGAPGVLLLPLQREFGWSTAAISSAMALRLMLFGLMGPFAAALINRYGVRQVTLAALSLIGAGFGLSMFMSKIWQLLLLWGVVVGVGTGLTALVLAATVSARWFHTRRGLIVGLLTASSATGQLVFLPALASLATRHGWRSALALVCVLLALAAVVVWMFMVDRPGDLGLRPVGADPHVPLDQTDRRDAESSSIAAAAVNALRDASHYRVFWILFATFFICGASTNGLIQTHFVSFCSDKGLGEVAAASVLAAMGIFDFFGTIASGWLSDRFNSGTLLFWYYGLRGLALVYLPFTDFNFTGLSFFALFYGLDWIATVPPTVNLTVKTFGPEKSNLVFGWVFAAHQLGAATAALSAGLSRTEFSTYVPAFVVAGALCIVAAGLALRIEPALHGRT